MLSRQATTVSDNQNRCSGANNTDNNNVQTPVSGCSALTGKHLICLRDLTKHRSTEATDLSPRDIKYIPPPALKVSPVSASLPTSLHSVSAAASLGPASVERTSSSSSPTSETMSTRPFVGSPPATIHLQSNGHNSTTSDRSTPCKSTSSVDRDNNSNSSPTGHQLQQQQQLGRGETRSPTGATMAVSAATGGGCEGQLNKLKRFLATVQQFADDVSLDIGDRVRALVLALVNSQLSVEEFHRRLQEATNFPLRPFVVPFLKANLPLLQEELTASNSGVRSPLPSPTGPDRPAIVPDVRPSPAALHRDAPALPLTGPSLPVDQRRLWYLGGLLPATTTGSLFPPRGVGSGLDLNANGKRPSAFDRVSDSPVDLKVEVFSPSSKRLHIDIPSSSHHQSRLQQPPSFVFTPLAGLQSVRLPPEDQAPPPPPAVARDLSFSSSERAQRISMEQDRGGLVNGNSSSHFNRCRPDVLANGTDDSEDDWKNVDNILQNIVSMVDRCRRAMTLLKDNCRREGRANGLTPGHGAAQRSPGAEALAFGPNIFRLTDDLQVLQVRQLAEEAVNEVKRQAVAELHRAVAAAEVKATVTVTAERARLEKVINEVRIQARQEAYALLNSQEDSSENCWNCGRKAYETCSGCHRARYCGTFCQHRHWETHHLTCKLQPHPINIVPSGSSPASSSSAAAGTGRRTSPGDGSTSPGPISRRSSPPPAEGIHGNVMLIKTRAETPVIDFSSSSATAAAAATSTTGASPGGRSSSCSSGRSDTVGLSTTSQNNTDIAATNARTAVV